MTDLPSDSDRQLVVPGDLVCPELLRGAQHEVVLGRGQDVGGLHHEAGQAHVQTVPVNLGYRENNRELSLTPYLDDIRVDGVDHLAVAVIVDQVLPPHVGGEGPGAEDQSEVSIVARSPPITAHLATILILWTNQR